jgi:hypothetical protein
MLFRILTIVFLFHVLAGCENKITQTQFLVNKDSTLIWHEGFLDIHHINTGRGNAAFFIFPDGTTMLFDAGDIDVEAFKKFAPLKVSSVHPHDSLTPGAWIARYINHVFPEGRKPQIDYAVISHFHGDHYGVITEASAVSVSERYRLSGITEVGDEIPIRKLIDRGYPDYNFPVNLKVQPSSDTTFLNYLSFIDYQMKENNMAVEQLVAGSKDQITLKNNREKFPSFQVRNLKSNEKLWTGESTESAALFAADDVIDANRQFNENPLSLALKISYGDFDYFTGGDNTGLQGPGIPAWFDVETPMAKVVGPVEVLTLNHHGNRDASNEFFLKTLSPQVVVQQSWCSDHPGMEVFHRLINNQLYEGSRDIFATNVHEETKVSYGPWFVNSYTSMSGHILIRVSPGGTTYHVFVIDDEYYSLRKLRESGPYNCK